MSPTLRRLSREPLINTMMTAANYLTVFERHLAPARQCRPFGILLLEGFIASLPRDLIQGDSGNTRRGDAPCRFSDRQTRQGEPSGIERIHTLGVLPKRATQEHRVTGVTMKPAKQPERRDHREMARQSERVKAAHCLPGRCFASATACRNSLNAIKSVFP